MKRAGFALFLVLIMISAAFTAVLNKPDKALALAPVDQSCSYATDPIVFTYLSHEPGEIFFPSKNTLDAVQVYIKAGIGASANVKMEVLSQHYGSIATKTQAVSDQWSWVLFDLTDVTMPFDTYGIKLRDADLESHAVWMQGTADCYALGWAIYEAHAHPEFDYRFSINAYDAANPAPSAGVPVDQGVDPADSSSIGISVGSGSAPIADTSSSISAPSNLTAANESSYLGTGIRLNWSPSAASSIDGYKIFRSTQENGSFSEIARMVSGITNYLDSTVTVGNTYYYFIRAYSGNSESASSNIASATAKDTFKEDILNDYKNNSSGGVLGGLLFFLGRVAIPLIIFGLIFILIIIGIILLVRHNRQKNQTQTQPENQKTGKK